jgi:hypothetical protein
MEIRDVIPRDAIPSIDAPEFGDDYFGDPDDEVVVVDGDPPRAYPLRILSYHEVVNDRIDGTPVAVTWCPLCGSAVVYERTVDGRVLTFGVSGKLADDDLVLYDRATESEWKQSQGRCIAGDLEGAELRVLPASVTTWARFRDERPDGPVLQPVDAESEAASEGEDPAAIDYDGRPYEEYFESEGFGLAAHRGGGDERSWDREDLDPKEVVLGVERDGEAVGYLRSRVETADGVVTDSVGGHDLVVFATGDGVHAFENPGYEVEPADEGFAADGATWDGTTGESDDGRRLERAPARRLFAFAWQDDHGPDSFYEP